MIAAIDDFLRVAANGQPSTAKIEMVLPPAAFDLLMQ
jgi:hypothetical protein